MNHNVKDIAKTLRDSKKQGTPVVAFTGAGCSKSAGMPLAYELIAEINKKYKGNLRDLSNEEKKDYGICMSKLTPHEQKTLIGKHISKAKINWAHIALASLLKNEYLGKVLTFNFDNILNRACSLDNFFPPIYDLKVLSEEYFTAIPNQSIVHLHGQWSGFQLANSDADTLSQASKLKNYIKNTINTSPSLFIGYSGGADAFFQLVDENFIGQHRLFWIDYSKEPNSKVRQFLEVNPNHRNFIGEQDADKFLLELAIELKCFPTELFKDPIKYLKEICEYVNNFPLNTSENEIDVLEDTKKTLAIADANKPAITQLKLVELLHAQKFETVINQEKKLDLKLKPISKIIASAYLGKALTFLTKDENQFQKNFDKAVELEPNFYQAYSEVGNKLARSTNLHDLEQAKLFYEKCFSIKPNLKDDIIIGKYAVVLSKLAELVKNDILFNQAFEQFKKALKIQPEHANNLGNYGFALYSLGILNEDKNLFHKAFDQYEKSLKIQPDNIDVLSNYSSALFKLGKINSDESLFHKAIDQDEKALKIQPDNINILGNYGCKLTHLAILKKEEALFHKSFEKFQKALKTEPNHSINLSNYGNALFELGKLKQDEKLIKNSLEQHVKALKLQPDHATRLDNYGCALAGLGKLKQDENLFQKALEQLTKAFEIQPKETYNLACYYAIRNQSDLAKQYLLLAEQHNTRFDNLHISLLQDDDFDTIRNESWFIELLERLKAKHELGIT